MVWHWDQSLYSPIILKELDGLVDLVYMASTLLGDYTNIWQMVRLEKVLDKPNWS